MFLKRLRESRGLTVTEASRQIGVSRQTIYKWENGEVLPTVENVNRMAYVYKISAYDIYMYLLDIKSPEKG